MASPGQGIGTLGAFSELVSTTYRNHSKEIADNVTLHNALFRRIAEKGQITTVDGGLSIVKPIEYAENNTYQRYSGYDTLNISASDVISAAEYPWRQVAINVTASGYDIRVNSGDSRIIALVKARIKNAQKTAANGMSQDLYSDGTASNQIGGIQSVISDLGTGTVGGIASASNPFWQNLVQSAAAPRQGGAAVTVSAATIEGLMLQLWLDLTRGTDKPDIIPMSNDYFTFYETSQTSLKRYTSEENGKGGMVSMKYKTADVFFDSSGGIPNQHAYFINTDYLEMVAHEDANFTMMDEMSSINQDAVVIPILFMGNLVCSNRKLQGVMKA